MPLSRLENFLVNTDGNILYVNPSDLDATDSFDNKGNSLTRPFITIQRALIEAARFTYQSGRNNDRFDRTTILLYPGEHTVDNRPGLRIDDSGQYFDVNNNAATLPELDNNSIFNLNDVDNILYKFNSVHGGVIVPKGTSIVGLDLRKTKVRPLYVPDPDFADNVIPRSALFRVTGGCYFWQFSMFDANQSVYFNKVFTEKRNPNISHHKLTCFEYADGINKVAGYSTTDLQQYYFKLMNAYGTDTGNRNIFPNYPFADGTGGDFEPNTPETKIVGDLSPNDNVITELSSTGLVASVTTEDAHGLTVDDQILITGVGVTNLYNGTYRVTGITSDRKFTYGLNSDAIDDVVNLSGLSPSVKIEADTVTGASPYIFNCSLRSVFGMCGLHADGSKATGFKSMVVAQFTGIGLQKDDKAFVIYNENTGDYLNSVNAAAAGFDTPLYLNPESQYRKRYENFHIKSTNDSFIQAVSVFAIGYANHFLAESGGEQSITNSNSNFGNKALVSKGFKRDAFNRDDTGFVTHIVPPKDLEKTETNIVWRSLDPETTKNVGISSHLYIDGEKDVTNPPTSIVNGFRIGAKKDDKLFLNVNIDGIPTTFSSPILMPVSTGDGPVAEKKFVVERTATGNVITSKVFTLTENHNFLNGESVRVFADDGRTPDGIELGRKYFVITIAGSGNENKIKLANTATDALSGKEIAKPINQRGGILTIQSTVTDKIPGEIGHPIQYDTTNNQWFILGSSGATNTIFSGFNTGTNAADIADNNSSTYVLRKSETRALNDRIYRLRYVIPKDFEGVSIAKKPEKNYVLQESKTVVEEKTVTNVITQRNAKIIAGITTSATNSLESIVTTEKAHKLSIGDKVRIRNVKSNTNLDPYVANPNSGYNGFFTVSSTPSSKTFTYTNTNAGFGVTTSEIADVVGVVTSLRESGQTSDLVKLPTFERSEYDTTYTIQEVETIQDYIEKQQDGVYYLTCLIGNISPTVSEFSDSKYRQNFTNLYPTIDKDNPNNDPVQAVSAASNKLLGKVDINNPVNSITKETAINYLRDNRIGFAVTFAESDGTTGLTTYTTNVEHNLNAITKLDITVAGTGYGNNMTRHNVILSDEDGAGTGDGATAKITTGGSGQIIGIEITDGGSAYGVGTTLAVSGGTSGVVEITGINNAVGNVMQVVGVGSTSNRTDSAFNGLFKISEVPSTKKVSHLYYPKGTSATNVTSAGIYTGPVSATSGILVDCGESIGITTIVGVANTTLSGVITVTTTANHQLSVGNKIMMAGMTGAGATFYNGTDFVVKEIIAGDQFTTTSPIGISTSAGGGEIFKYALNSFGQDSSLASEKISGSLSPFITGVETLVTQTGGMLSAGTIVDSGDLYGTTDTQLTSTVGINTGDFLQIENEIVRVKSIANTTNISLFRGVLGTKSVAHERFKSIKKINVIPSEVHRFSAIRASGHTFEYIGYGPGNYSTSLPQKIKRTIEPEEEILAISREEKGGVVFFSGMNDRGDFFSGQKEEARELVLGDDGDSNSAIFDDVFIRNTLRVGGGANQNLPSEFNGPVNFTNKITSTDAIDGIEAIKLLVKGNAIDKPFFQVGDDTSPSLIVNRDSQNVGINTRNPNTNIELDINGTVRANAYENFKLSDLPDATEEPNYARNRIIKVKDDGSGYEMIDPHDLPAYELRSLGVSNDGTIYHGNASIVDSKLRISGLSTSRFFVGERVKIFGVTKSNDAVTVPNPLLSTGSSKVLVSSIPSVGFSTARTYYYWQAQYHLRNGKVGIATQIDPTGSYSGSGARVGVANTILESFNGVDHNALTLSRSPDHGILIYRQIYTHPDQTAPLSDKISANNADITQAKLIAVLGQKELGNSQNDISWKDFGVYEQTAWSAKGDDNEFLGSDSDTTLTNQIHFPVTPRTTVGGRGWDIDQIVEIGAGYIGVSSNYLLNGTAGFGTASTVKVVHDNTESLQNAVTDIIAAGGNYLSLPSGTFLTNKLILPSQFTLRGNGKNSIIKLQYYATDTTRVGTAGTAAFALSEDGNLVGSSVANPTDMTISNLTFDGNSSNNLLFTLESENNLVTLASGTSMLFKDMEIRNAGGGGLYARDSKRVSIENCTIVDGGQTDRYNEFRPLDVQNSETVRINDSLFENYAGALDVSVTTVVATGGNIIRNCGSGIDAYATGKITTQNNVILGPGDEFIASPDIYDTDFDSINITIDTTTDFEGPELLYIENGEGKDITSSKVDIVAGIGTIVGLYSTTRTASLGPKFIDFVPVTQDTAPATANIREAGYIQLKMTNATINSSPLPTYVGSSTALGYEIVGTEYLEKPVGFNTFIGIASGYWANGGQYVDIPSGSAGIAVTQYIVRLEDAGQLTGISTGDVVKLPGHEFSHKFGTLANGVSIGMTDHNNNYISQKNLGLTVERPLGADRIVLTGFGVTALSHGTAPKVGDYISIRRIFTIAKGRVGVI